MARWEQLENNEDVEKAEKEFENAEKDTKKIDDRIE